MIDGTRISAFTPEEVLYCIKQVFSFRGKFFFRFSMSFALNIVEYPVFDLRWNKYLR